MFESIDCLMLEWLISLGEDLLKEEEVDFPLKEEVVDFNEE